MDVFQGQIELILAMLERTTVFGAPIDEYPQQGHFLFTKRRDHAVIEQVSRPPSLASLQLEHLTGDQVENQPIQST
jgi:hypothetical protein